MMESMSARASCALRPTNPFGTVSLGKKQIGIQRLFGIQGEVQRNRFLPHNLLQNILIVPFMVIPS